MQMSKEKEVSFINSNLPIMTFYHDAIKGGNLGFYCNNCFGSFVDGYHL